MDNILKMLNVYVDQETYLKLKKLIEEKLKK